MFFGVLTYSYIIVLKRPILSTYECVCVFQECSMALNVLSIEQTDSSAIVRGITQLS